jgi:O-antigen ligase
LTFAGRLDWRIGLIFQLDLKGALAEARFPVLYGLASRLAYAERVMYWAAASRVFDLHPLLGVGLGNSGQLFLSTVPAFGYYLPEIIQIANPGTPQFPNPKSLWLRLLAETGVVGFVLFAVWLVFVGVTSWRALRSERPLPGVVGLASGMALIALVIEGFSLDTFALPQLWILFGLLTSLDRLPGSPRASAPAALGAP